MDCRCAARGSLRAGAVSGGVAPDLRASAIPLTREAFADVVSGGSLRSRGMPRFADLGPEDVEAIRHYIRSQVPAVAEAGSR